MTHSSPDEIHRDNVNFEWLENLENKLDAKISFSNDAEILAKRARLRKLKKEALENFQCWQCKKQLPKFKFDPNFNIDSKIEDWPALDLCRPMFNLLENFRIGSLICNECYYKI